MDTSNQTKLSPWYSSVQTKLALAILAAILTSFTSDLSRYTCSHFSWSDITPIHWCVIVGSAFVQGAIAWRAFVDGSAQKQKDLIEHKQ